MPLHNTSPDDPRGLIAEAFEMDIGAQDCRSIFFDWALAEAGPDQMAKLDRLIDRFRGTHSDHPMFAVLIESKREGAATRRRGGHAARAVG